MRKVFNARNLMRLIFAAFIASIIYAVAEIILAPTVAPPSDTIVKIKSDYVIMLVKCVLGAAAMMLPGYLRRIVRLDIPNLMMIVYAMFLFCGIFLGEVRNFYYRVPHWDTILHLISGLSLCALGFSLISLLNKSDSVSFSLSPAFAAIFAFCFAVTLGVFWEIFEFAVDSILLTNSQRYALESGEPLIGQAALMDTMKDLIANCLGSGTFSIFGLLSLKRGDAFLKKLSLKMIDD